MKTFIPVMTLLMSFMTFAQELQLDECQFGKNSISFTPTSTLTSFLKKEVDGSVVYRVKYKTGMIENGPKKDLAFVKVLNNKILEVNFFEHDDEDGIMLKNFRVTINLSAPKRTEGPLIIFNSSLYEDIPVKGQCSLMF